MAERRPWSLAGRLRFRLVLAMIAIAGVTTFVVALEYGSNVDDLRTRKVYDMAEALATALARAPAGEAPGDTAARLQPAFRDHPAAYGWRIAGAGGRVEAASAFPWATLAEEPAVERADIWTRQSPGGDWVAGRAYERDGERRQVLVVARGDPAGLLVRKMGREILVHVLLPALSLAALVIWATVSVVSRTLRPLGALAEQAAAVRTFGDIRPIDVKDAPVEVRQVVLALNATLTALAEAMERERGFILDASHALRTPLAALKARLELQPRGTLTASLQQDVDALVRLTSQLLALANSERLKVDPSQVVSLRDVVVEVVCRLEPLAHAKGVELGVEAADRAVTVQGDADAIAHALVNLVENAIRHTPAGGSVTVVVRAGSPGIAVVDGGPGVPAERLAGLFGRFSRKGFGTGDGAGLGLSIVKRIMDAHGGGVEATSPAGGGLTVALIFPAATAGRGAPSTPPAMAGDVGQR